MTSTAVIPVGINRFLVNHYAAVRRRLGMVGAPVNNKDAHIANAARLREERAQARAELRSERRAELAAAGFIGRKTRNVRPDVIDPVARLKGLPFDDSFTPELREPVDIILRYFGVAWSEIVGPSRIKVVASARAALVTFLVDLHGSPYTLAKLLDRDESTIRTIVRVNGKQMRELGCFLDAMTCVKDNGLSTLHKWKLPHDKNLKRKDR